MLTSHYFNPSPPLQPYVERYMLLKESYPLGWQQTLIPSNIQNIGFILKGHILSNIFDNGRSFISRSYVLGQISKPTNVTYYGNLEVLYIMFKPSGMYHFFGIPMHEFTDAAADFELIAGKEGKELVEKIFEPIQYLQRIAFIESFLLRLLDRRSHFIFPVIAYASRQIEVKNGNISVKKLANQVNMCDRSFERHFIEKVGLPPKIFSGIIRIKSTLQLIETMPKLKWTDIAYTMEYTDQAHFIHDFRKFTGQTPSAYYSGRSDFEHAIYSE